jgi:hypothetical protein
VDPPVGAEPEWCVGTDGAGQTAESCESLAIAPIYEGTCGDTGDLEPLGYLTCRRAFEIYTPGHAEELVWCLGGVAEADACDDTLVAECVNSTYAIACERGDIIDKCQLFAQSCGEVNESFDAETCAFELTVFSDLGVSELAGCMDIAEGDCQARYDSCFDEVVSL